MCKRESYKDELIRLKEEKHNRHNLAKHPEQTLLFKKQWRWKNERARKTF